MASTATSSREVTREVLSWLLEHAETSAVKQLVADIDGDAVNLPLILRIRLLVQELMATTELDHQLLREFEELCDLINQAHPDDALQTPGLPSGLKHPQDVDVVHAYASSVLSQLSSPMVEVGTLSRVD